MDIKKLEEKLNRLYKENKLSIDTYVELMEFADPNQALQLQQGGVSGSDILDAINESMELIDYMHQLTVIPNNMHEDYANRFANTMSLLATLRNHYR